MKFTFAVLAAILWPLASFAQSAADLRQLATQDAQQYGVPVDLFLNQIQGESGFNPNVPNSSSGAIGIAQALPSTAADPGFGIAAFDPHDPAASLQFAAQYDAALYQQTGSWVGALEKYTGGLPTTSNNQAYNQAFADALQADSGGPVTTTTSPDGSTVIATQGSTATVSTDPGPLSNFFEWLDAQLTGTLDQTTTALINEMQGALGNIVAGLAVIAAFGLALLYWDGQFALRPFIFFAISLAIVASVTSTLDLYQQWVIYPAENLPNWWEGVLYSTTNSPPAALFDYVYNNIYALEKQIMQSAPTGILNPNTYWLGLKLSIADTLLQVAEWGMYLPFAATKIVIRIALVLGPICIPFVLFESTKGITSGWVRVILSALGSMLVADILLLYYAGIIQSALGALTVTGTPDTDVLGFGGFVAIAMFFGFIGFFIPGATAWRIFGAAGVVVPAAQRLMSGLIFKDAVKAAV